MIILAYKNGLESTGKSHFLPILKVLEQYPFPKPVHCSRIMEQSNKWLKSKIIAFTSPKFLGYLDGAELSPNRHMVWVDGGSDKHLHLCISQGYLGSVVELMNTELFLNPQETRNLFKDLIGCNSTCYEATGGNSVYPILNKNFSAEERHTKTMLSWLEYFSQPELEKRGGFMAFESNPYLQTERIHDGLMVKVGKHDVHCNTVDETFLLINAINALPPIKQ
jgi:hypothetical protein